MLSGDRVPNPHVDSFSAFDEKPADESFYGVVVTADNNQYVFSYPENKAIEGGSGVLIIYRGADVNDRWVTFSPTYWQVHGLYRGEPPTGSTVIRVGE